MSGESVILVDDVKEFCSQLKEVSYFLGASDNNRVDALWLKNIVGESPHDWWWADYTLYGLFDLPYALQGNEVLKSFISGSH
jgi:hypothetical protein